MAPLLHSLLVFLVFTRLEYKYQRLVQSSSAAAELPAPPKCVDDEDEEEAEDGEEVDVSLQLIFSLKLFIFYYM